MICLPFRRTLAASPAALTPSALWRARLLGGAALALLPAANPGVAAPQGAQTLQAGGALDLTIEMTAPPLSPLLNPVGVSPDIGRFAPPQTIETIDATRIRETTNTVDTEDAIKYLPSLFLRKRNIGDTQPTLQTRNWGVNSSARSLVYADDVPISALISNNNTTGAPRWGLVSPEEIKGLDFLYGPYAAQYPGNSIGGVLLITTLAPERFAATATQTGAVQSFDLYKTHGTYGTSDSAVTMGDKAGRFSWFLSANREESASQPLYFVTNGSIPAGTTGAIAAFNKTGAVANVVGAGGLLHSTMNNVTAKANLDLTDWLRATYMVGYWDNDTHSSVQSYLRTTGGLATFGGVAGFASNTYTLQERHLANALSLKTDTRGNWDWEAIATRYDYLDDIQRTPAGVAGQGFTGNGTIARLDGTGWSTQDLKAIWRPAGIEGDHEVSVGAHRDLYVLNNPTYNSADWISSGDTGTGTLFTVGRGQTETYGFWLQDAWKLAPALKLTLGGRLDSWRASDGFNLAGKVAVRQPTERSTDVSPKATLAWQVDDAWSAKASFGEAYRYPTVAELYQIVATGSTYAVPNPNLTPENVYSGEVTIERQGRDSKVRLSLFQENTRNALISQTNLVNSVYTTSFQNVAKIRNRGVEFVIRQQNAFFPGLELSNSVTYVDSRILSDPTFQSAAGTSAVGKHVPYVPVWRDTVQATYRPNDALALSLAARYQGKMYSTLDNTDIVSNVYGGFDRFFVLDTHVHYQINTLISADAGIDNLLNAKYFEFHPFPGRTYVAAVKATF